MNIEKFLDQHEKKSLLRFITCGSVDDGKSTLIGRLLFDSKLIFEDQIKALKNDTEKIGTTKQSGKFDYALLLDGLKSEREQGITIDVAYRYFSTPKRKFIIADTPGHEQYTRNMATGASTADLAIILIDASAGILPQTRRHSFIVSLLGIKHVVVAVNKMDLVDYSEDVFENIKSDFKELAEKFSFSSINYFPLSALEGVNVVNKLDFTPWYDGPTLLDYLENIDVSGNINLKSFRFPVQYVNRPDATFRGYSGTIVSGVIQKGDKIVVFPSKKKSKISEIVTFDAKHNEAFAPQAVTLTLKDEIDIGSGDIIVKEDDLPEVTNYFSATVIWMYEKGLELNHEYIIRHCSRNVKAQINEIIYKTDVNNFEKKAASKLELNEIGEVKISSVQPLFFDKYSQNRETGSFIIIDPITNNTVGMGLISGAYDDGKVENESPEACDVKSLITEKERLLRNQHGGAVLLIPDIKNSAAFAVELERKLFDLNLNTFFVNLKDSSEQILKKTVANLISSGLIAIVLHDSAIDVDAAKVTFSEKVIDFKSIVQANNFEKIDNSKLTSKIVDHLIAQRIISDLLGLAPAQENI